MHPNGNWISYESSDKGSLKGRGSPRGHIASKGKLSSSSKSIVESTNKNDINSSSTSYY
jgi:hypothetical protein